MNPMALQVAHGGANPGSASADEAEAEAQTSRIMSEMGNISPEVRARAAHLVAGVASTGFMGLDRLPAGAARLRADHWRRVWSEDVQAERTRAREAAAAGLRLAYPDLVRSRVAGLLKARRWADADAFLDRADSGSWLELEGLELDLRGLDDAERLEVAAEIDALARSDRSNVRYRMAAAVDEVSDFIDAERQAGLDQIQAGEVTGPRSLVDGFNDALEAKSAILGLDMSQLTEEFRAPLLGEVNEVRAALSVAESVRREELAAQALSDLEEQLGPLRRQRDYPAVRAALSEALAQPWRRSTHAAIRARIRETELLDMVLQLLTPWPDLFAAMACSRAWCDAARVNYANRRRTVPATPRPA